MDNSFLCVQLYENLQLGVQIALVEVITWTTANEISVVSDSETLLNNFRGYVGRVPTPHDALMLIT